MVMSSNVGHVCLDISTSANKLASVTVNVAGFRLWSQLSCSDRRRLPLPVFSGCSRHRSGRGEAAPCSRWSSSSNRTLTCSSWSRPRMTRSSPTLASLACNRYALMIARRGGTGQLSVCMYVCRCAGRSLVLTRPLWRRRQGTSQTNEDDLTEEIQTDEVRMRHKWTQYPIQFDVKVTTNDEGEVVSGPTYYVSRAQAGETASFLFVKKKTVWVFNPHKRFLTYRNRPKLMEPILKAVIMFQKKKISYE